jgi:MFS family permease
VGRIVKYFVLTDLTLLAGWGLIEPVLSVFILKNIPGATLTTVGISTAVYWLTRCLLQLPIANYLDRTEGENDDFRSLIAGLLLLSVSAFSFILVDRTWQLYLIQAIHAIGFAFYVPAWSGIFSRHLDRDRMSFDWSLDSTAIGLSTGIAGLTGGILANQFGFTVNFALASVFSLGAAFLLLMTPALILPPPTQKKEPPSGITSP